MNKYLALGLVVLLAGCDNSEYRQQKQQSYNDDITHTKGLDDCIVFLVHDDRSDDLTVIRCPNSSTTTSRRVASGKSTRQIQHIVVDGVTYAPVEETNQ